MVKKPFKGGRRNGKGKLLRRLRVDLPKKSSLQVRRHTQKNQEQPTHNLYDDQRLDEKEYEKSADPGLIKYFDKLGISLNEKYQLANVATYAVLHTVSIATTDSKKR
nr:uncharacterized protein [Tanacetum cinerariifolium]